MIPEIQGLPESERHLVCMLLDIEDASFLAARTDFDGELFRKRKRRILDNATRRARKGWIVA